MLHFYVFNVIYFVNVFILKRSQRNMQILKILMKCTFKTSGQNFLNGCCLHLIHIPTLVSPKRHVDRFSPFCGAYKRDEQTNTETDRQTTLYSVCSNSPHLIHWAHAMLPDNNNNHHPLSCTSLALIFILVHARFILQLQQSGILSLLIFIRLIP